MVSIWKLPIALIVILVVCFFSYLGLGFLNGASSMFMAGYCGIKSYFVRFDIWFLISYLFYFQSNLSFAQKHRGLLSLKTLPNSFVKELYLSNLAPAVLSNLTIVLSSFFQGITCTPDTFVVHSLTGFLFVPFTSIILCIFSLISYLGISFLLRYLEVDIAKPK